MVNKYGSRPVMIAGGILCSFGMIASSFCNSVLELYLCIGVVGGKSVPYNILFFLMLFYLTEQEPTVQGILQMQYKKVARSIHFR